MDVSLMKKLPNCVIHSTVSQSEDEDAWVYARTSGIGGSDIGAICGVSPFSSARQIYMSKTGQFSEALTFSDAAKDRMRFGHLLEPIVADEYAIRTGAKLIEFNVTVKHKDYPWALANVDRLEVDEDGNILKIIECKTTGEYNNEDWENGDLLLSYIYQLNWYMWILDIKQGAFACLVGGNKFYYYDVFRNDELINDVLIPAAKAFWFDNVLALKEPELQAADTDFAKATYTSVVKNSEILLEDDIANDLAATVVDCKSKIKELESIMEEAQNRLKDRLKDHEIGYTKDFTVKWSPRSQKRVDTDKLKLEFPQVYEQVQKTIEFRAMSIKGGL